MKKKRIINCPFRALKKLGKHFAALLTGLFLMIFLDSVQAGPFFWDPSGANPTGPSDGSGNWDDTTVSNWWSSTLGLTVYSNTPSTGTNVIIGAGVLGAYNITNINGITALSLTFSNAGSYTISGGQLQVNQTANSTPVVISLPNTTNTIAVTGGTFWYLNQGNDISNAPNSTLNINTTLEEFGGNPRFIGINDANSIVNMNGPKVFDSTSSSTFQVTGVTLNITNGAFDATARLDVSRNTTAAPAAIINVYNNGQLNADYDGGANGGNHLQLTRSGGNSSAILNVYPGGFAGTYIGGLNAGAYGPDLAEAGNIRLVPDAGGGGTVAALNVLGGTVQVGDGYGTITGTSPYAPAGSYSPYLMDITFFDSSPTVTSATSATLNMSAGSITAWEILFDVPGGSGYASNPTNGINVTGGTLYLGTPNISYPSAGAGANFNCNLSGGTISAIQSWSPACAAPINLTNVNGNGNITFQTTDIGGTTPYNMAFSGPMTGTGGFNLIGPGVLTLSGADNYSGATVVSNGTLIVQTVSAPVGGAVTLQGAGLATGLPTNSVQTVGSGHAWTVTGLTYASGVPTADFNFGTYVPSTTTPAIQVNGNVAFTATPQVEVDGSNIPKGTYPLITYSGSVSGTFPTTLILNSIYSGYLTNITATKTIAVVITSSPVIAGLVWDSGSGIWAANTSIEDWTANGVVTNFGNGQPVTFNDTAPGPFPITVTVSNVNPNGITVSSTNAWTFTGVGVISGTGTLTKNGSGMVTLTGTNTYSGGTIVDASGGTLDINYGGNGINNSAIGTGPLSLNMGASLGNSSGQSITLLTPIVNNWYGNWTYVGPANLDLGPGAVNLSNTLTLTVTNTLEVDGQISDNGANYGITKAGPGTLVLSNANTFGGGLDLASGALILNNAGAAGSGTLTLAGSTVLDNQSGAPEVLSVGGTILGSFTFLGTADLDLGNGTVSVNGTETVDVSNSASILALEGGLSGASTSIILDGPGGFSINGSGASTSVAFTVNDGTLYANRGNPFPSFGQSQAITVNSNGTFVVLNPDGAQFNMNIINLDGGLMELNGDSGETLNQLTFTSGGILQDSAPQYADVILSTTYNGVQGVTLSGVSEFNITNGATLAIYGPVGGSASVVLLKAGLGELILETNTTYAGDTVVSNGVLSLTWPTLSTTNSVTIDSGATLDLNFTNTVSTTNVVAALIVDGTSEPAGIYNSNNLASITSGGSLQVVPPLTVNPIPGAIQFSFIGNTLNLAWPTNAGWSLQSNTNLLDNNWVTVPGSASVTNLSFTTTNPAMFYRMFLVP